MSLTIRTVNPPEVTFYVRGDMFGANDQQHAVVRRLHELEDAGHIEGYDVEVWTGRVDLSTAAGSTVVERYREFASWADDEGVDIDPFFTVRERESFVDGTARELILPVMCLAVRTDDELVAVAPTAQGEEVTTVQDCLDALATRDVPARRVTVPAED